MNILVEFYVTLWYPHPRYAIYQRWRVGDKIENIVPDKNLDCKGLSCPMPILKTKKALDGMQSGQILEVLGTDPASENDLPAFARNAGHEYLGAKREDGFTRYYLRAK